MVDVCRGKVEGRDRQQACDIFVARDARKSHHHEVQNSPQLHDGVSGDQAQETSQPDATVWRERESRLDEAEGKSQKEQAGFDSSIWSVRRYRTTKFVVLTLVGAVAVHTVHRLSEDQHWETEFMRRVKGAPWDSRDDVNDGGILEGADAPPPDVPIEIPQGEC